MKIRRLSLLLFLPFLVACHDELELPEEGTTRVVIVYMMGENSLSSYATADLAEIQAGLSLMPDSATMVVFFDNSSTSVKPQIISFDKKNGKQVMFEYSSDPVATDSATMERALQYIISEKPADEYALILWSHGSGWLPASRTIGIDNGNNKSYGSTADNGTEMEIVTLRNILNNLGIHWKYLMWDACFMQCVEVAYELRTLTDWLLGSPAEIPAMGADYTALMPLFFQSADFASALALAYYNTYADGVGVVYSAIRTDQLDALAASMANALQDKDSFPTDNVQQYCLASTTHTEYYDMGSLLNAWGAYDTVLSALNAAVPHRYATSSWTTVYEGFSATMTDPDHFAGLSMYVPQASRTRFNSTWRAYEWYDAVGHLIDL